ncbi:hypothetical protein HMPREF0080_02093 [Anaeroglobus geminatus F0357]|uniref:Uncharacterized protein n=1 Tax=Anaeroglobus geminatus F0357 TaxID=861450 RepID=G9YK83_9FIRM|nr:hypothetical protein HMPREF0080_02093 [Anaeroglobus geminatus F0357]
MRVFSENRALKPGKKHFPRREVFFCARNAAGKIIFCAYLWIYNA